MAGRSVAIPGAELEVFDWGTGDPVVFIQTALTADELLPLAEQSVLDEGFRKIVYHRRGYAGSTPAVDGSSIGQDAEDCRALLAALGVPSAHVVGYSYSGAVAMQLAADHPAVVRSLVLIEPPPVHTASAHEFRAANERLIRSRHDRGPAAALDEFLGLAIVPRWRQVIEARVPGSGAQMVHDAVTFFDVDLPALLSWTFTKADAARITCPVLFLGGSDSGAWFQQVRWLLQEWFPHASVMVLQGADHSLTVTHTAEVAAETVNFLRRVGGGPDG
jgi:pimeloyl-ACP methyl ester carboxylesterase